MSVDKRTGNLRMICLLCGQEIQRTKPLTEQPIYIERHGFMCGTGWAHPGCANGQFKQDLTGKPDYGDYNDDDAHPAYAEGYDPVVRGVASDERALKQKAKKG